MKKLALFLVVLGLVFGSVGFSYAWEFSMTGEFEWRYRYWGRIGGYDDLFGNMNAQKQLKRFDRLCRPELLSWIQS